MNNVQTAHDVGLLDTVKNKVGLESMMVQIQESKGLLIDMALYGGIGFLAGYLIKRYSTVVILIVLLLTGMFVLQQYDIISVTINVAKINELLGMQTAPVVMTDNMPVLLWEWMHANMPIVITVFIGFLIGLKIG